MPNSILADETTGGKEDKAKTEHGQGQDRLAALHGFPALVSGIALEGTPMGFSAPQNALNAPGW